MIKIKIILLSVLIFFLVSINSAPVYHVYTAMIYQSGTNNPTVNVMQNDIGAITWTRISKGYYTAKKIDAFPLLKTFLIVNTLNESAFLYGTPNELILTTKGSDGSLQDNILLYGGFVEIRVYNVF